jgi:hypothetical protein
MSKQNNPARASRTAPPAARRANQPLTADSRPARELLRGAQNAITERDPARALRILECLNRRTTDENLRRRICLRAAELANKQGRYHDASQWFLQATRRSWHDSELLTQAAVGQCRALLRHGRADLAKNYAQAALLRAITIEQDYLRRRAAAEAQLARGQRATIPPRPVRASVAASRFAAQFLAEGELVHARDLYQRAIAANPHGATRAREGLAKIALAAGELPEAEARIREALLVGKYQRKTCSLWPLWVQARLRQNKHPLPPELLPAILKIKHPGVRSTHLWQLITALRSAGHDAWKGFATQVTPHLQEHHIREVNRLLALEHRKTGNAAALHTASATLLATPLEPTRWLATAKDNFSSALRLGQHPDPQPLIAAAARLDDNFARRTRHALGLVARREKNYPLAEVLFTQALQNSPPQSVHHHRAIWALAETCKLQKNSEKAAQHYFQFADNPHPPQELRIKARLNAIHVLMQSGNKNAIAAHLPRIETEARNLLPDWFATLNICRYLVHCGDLAKQSAERLYQQAKTIAENEFTTTPHHTRKIQILEQLNRRRIHDLGLYKETREQYRQIKHQVHNLLWSTAKEYYDYLEWVYEALIGDDYRNNKQEAKELCLLLIEDAATPESERARFALLLGEWLIRPGKQGSQSKQWFKMAAESQPRNEIASRAHFWLMIHAVNDRQDALAKQHAKQVLLHASNPEVKFKEKVRNDCARVILDDANDPPKFFEPDYLRTSISIRVNRINKTPDQES